MTEQKQEVVISINNNTSSLSIVQQLAERRARLTQSRQLNIHQNNTKSASLAEPATLSTESLDNDDNGNSDIGIIHEDEEIALYLQRQEDRNNNFVLPSISHLNQTRNRRRIKQQKDSNRKYKKRRKRKNKSNNNKVKLKSMHINDEYEYHLTIMKNMKNEYYLTDILVAAYIHDICDSSHSSMDLERLFSKDIELLCQSFMPSFVEPYYFCFSTKLHDRNKLMNIKFGLDYQSRLINVNLFSKTDKYSTINIKFIKTYQHSRDTVINSLHGIEYILLMNTIYQKEIKCLNLSNFDMTDDRLFYLCTIIENVAKYYKNKVKSFIDLRELDLSGNNEISDKYLYLLSQIIKKYLLNFNRLYLKGTNNSYKTIPFELMQYVDMEQDNLIKKKPPKIKYLMQRGPHGHTHF